jgi:hypothetical protein
MKYFWVLFDWPVDAMVAEIVDFKTAEPEDLTFAQPIHHWDPSSYLKVGPGGQEGAPDDVLQTSVTAPIFSSRLKETLDSSGIGGIQYLPVQVYSGTPGAALGTFYVANVIASFSALNPSRSVFSRYKPDYFIDSRRGKVSGIRTPVLRPSALSSGPAVFRLAEFAPPVFVSERFRDIFKIGRFSGLDFIPVELSDED